MPFRLFPAIFVAISLTACSSLEFPWVYRISVQQGNILDQEDIENLEVGMTKRQVQFVMGSPLLVDTFNQDRWDYYYSRRDGDGNTREKRLTLFFEDDKYVRHEGDVVPSKTETNGEKVLNDEESRATDEALKATEKKRAAEF